MAFKIWYRIGICVGFSFHDIHGCWVGILVLWSLNSTAQLSASTYVILFHY